MSVELTKFEQFLGLPESDATKTLFREQEARRAERRIDYVSPELEKMGGLAIYCALYEVELAEAA